MKDSFLNLLEEIETSIKSLKGFIKFNKGEFISKKAITDLSKDTSRKWFEEVEPSLKTIFSIDDQIIQRYHGYFDKLLKLSLASKSRKSSYSLLIESLLTNFKSDLIAPVVKCSPRITRFSSLFFILEHVTEKEGEYLEEAIKCANLGFLRASVILGWCAAISRIHDSVEKMGFETFNKKSEEMKEKKDGRFKRFGKSFKVYSNSELSSQVFDNDLLWVIEYMGLIDSNQHDRLSLCFTMRNNSAHPGDAPITEPNVHSFYSDLDEIIFNNEKFKI